MRRRLVAVALAVTSMVALAFLIPLMLLTTELARDRALAVAEQRAETVAQLMSVAGPNADPDTVFGSLGFTDVSAILPNGVVLGADIPAGEDLSGARSGAAGSQDVPGGAAVYVPVVTGDGETIVVRTFVSTADLTENVGRSWFLLAGLGLVLIGVAVLVADRLGRSMVRPVAELSQAAGRLGDGDLATRVEPSGPPELERVGREFNHLAHRVKELLQSERETAADLSHRLRTPLTAARLDVESLPIGEDRDRLIDDLDALQRAIDHIINEARRPIRRSDGRADAVSVIEERSRFWEALAEEQGRTTDLTLSASAPAWCSVDPDELAAAIDALIGNVFAHTDEGTAYAVHVTTQGAAVSIRVDDAGPGFPDADVLSRGRSDGGSTGLGLDIARRTAEGAGGRFALGSSPLGGGRATMVLPVRDP